jgi:hypothetical protein
VPRADLRTLGRLAFRHLTVRRGRALFLLLGYGIGAGVMMVLLSIGEAMLVQSRDVALVGGGDVTVLPEGIDLEGLRTGSMSGLFHGIDRARFLERQMIGGPRLAGAVAATSATIENKLLYLRHGGQALPVRAGGEIPSAARAVGAGLELTAGAWDDEPGDRAFRAPAPGRLYDELDRFHTPRPDSTWAEWHYFNVAPSADEWWYLTFLVGGAWHEGRGGGQLLVTRHRPGRPPARFERVVPQAAVTFDTLRADLAIGDATVEQRDGTYRIRGEAPGADGGRVRFDLRVVPEPNAWFPPLELRSDEFVSGYVVPAVRATASGTICEDGACRRYDGAPAYHDHNWGIWRETSWNWGQARGAGLSVLYGGVLTPDSLSAPSAAPYFLAVVDSLGVRQVLRFAAVGLEGARPVPGVAGLAAPERLRIVAARGADTVDLAAEVLRVQATPTPFAGAGRWFLQMRGAFTVRGRVGGVPVADSGLGFFETFVARGR